MHKVFISYHHANDQWYKEELLRINQINSIFIDGSVDTGDISDDLTDESIRQKIRDEYLRDTSVTILLVGTDTKGRKHIDWEIYSSMIDGHVNKKSGVLIINLPATDCTSFHAAHGDVEKKYIHPETTSWMSLKNRSDYEQRYLHMPNRIIDNLHSGGAYISVVPWDKVANDPEKLEFLIDETFNDRTKASYDLSRDMRRISS